MTDVCCTVVGAIFALTMFIIACVLWNRGKSAIIQPISIKSTIPKPDPTSNHAPSISISLWAILLISKYNLNLIFSPEHASSHVSLDLSQLTDKCVCQRMKLSGPSTLETRNLPEDLILKVSRRLSSTHS